MKKLNVKVAFAAVVASLVLCFSMGVAADTATPSDAVNAVVYADVQADGAFAVPYQMVNVNSYLAESYGFPDSVSYKDNVSALDVMVKLEVLKYGSAFTAATTSDGVASNAYLSVSTEGWVLKAFGETTYAWSFIVNGECPHSDTTSSYGGYEGLTLNQATVESGDVVEMVKYQDTSAYADNCIWTMNSAGNYEPSTIATVGDDITLTLKSYSYMTYGAYGTDAIKSSHLSALSGAKLAIMNKDGSLTDIDNAVSDANGDVTISFDQAGAYNVVAYLPSDNSAKAFMAVYRVNVIDPIDVKTMTDVKDGDWYQDAVAEALHYDVMIGTSGTTFSPMDSLTRGMFATIIYRYMGSPVSTATNPFTDIGSDEYYTDAINWAYAMGIINGKTATTFDPNAVLTREQMATMIYRTACEFGFDLSDGSNVDRYSDDASISSYAAEAVYSLTDAGILKGIGNNTFAPQDVTTRAQAAMVIMKLMSK